MMSAVIVFHLQGEKDGRFVELILRYDFDPECDVEPGDRWDRTSSVGDVTFYLVREVRLFEGIRGEELHVFLDQVLLIEA